MENFGYNFAELLSSFGGRSWYRGIASSGEFFALYGAFFGPAFSDSVSPLLELFCPHSTSSLELFRFSGLSRGLALLNSRIMGEAVGPLFVAFYVWNHRECEATYEFGVFGVLSFDALPRIIPSTE